MSTSGYGPNIAGPDSGARFRGGASMRRVAPTQQYHASSSTDRVKVVSILIIIVGAYILLSAWRRDLDIGNQLNAIVAGAITCALGVGIYEHGQGTRTGWVVVLIGVWFMISPWIYRFAG